MKTLNPANPANSGARPATWMPTAEETGAYTTAQTDNLIADVNPFVAHWGWVTSYSLVLKNKELHALVLYNNTAVELVWVAGTDSNRSVSSKNVYGSSPATYSWKDSTSTLSVTLSGYYCSVTIIGYGPLA